MDIQHKKVKFLIALREEKKVRDESGLVLVSGKKMVEEIGAHFPLETLLVTDRSFAKGFNAKELLVVSEALLKKITNLPSPEPIAAVFPLPKPSALSKKKRLLILDSINDPGNLGTLIRTALALNFDGVALTGACSDPFNDKALRAAKGATFFIDYAYFEKRALVSFLESNSFTTYVADLGGEEVSKVQVQSPFALLLGNESHGPNVYFKEKGHQVSIPISEKTNSLNVAVAGAILMYTLGAR